MTPLKQIVGFTEKIEFFKRRITAQKKLMSKVDATLDKVRGLERKIEILRESIGRIEERQIKSGTPMTTSEAEFQVFSQWGEDGVLQYLLNKIPETNKTFVEFGVESFIEANCRWLLTNHGWSGLVIDGSSENIEEIQRDPIYWKHNLKAVQAFVTADNINQILDSNGLKGDLGILSVDVDGVDYWIWKAITCVRPALVIVEYNSLFGSDRSVTVPYRPDFRRDKAHFSYSYYGASISALTKLGHEKGYSLVASNNAGNNAFFIRKDLMVEGLLELEPCDAYKQRNFREARNQDGLLDFPTFEEESKLISKLPLVEL